MSVIYTPQGVYVCLPPATGSRSPRQGQTHILVRPDCIFYTGPCWPTPCRFWRAWSRDIHHSSDLLFMSCQNYFCIYSLAGGVTFCQGLSGVPQRFSSIVGHFVYGGPRSSARNSTKLTLFYLTSPQEPVRGGARQPEWLPRDASRTTVL